MKMAPLGLLVGCLLSFGFDALGAPPVKVQISAQIKHTEGEKKGDGSGGTEVKKTENVSYALTVKNVTFADLPELTLDYILFVQRQKLGEKKTVKSPLERVTGSLKVAALARQASTIVPTDEVKLVTQNIAGGWLYYNGGRIKAEDSIEGVWVRVSQDGQVVGEYTMPSTVTKQGWDKK